MFKNQNYYDKIKKKDEIKEIQKFVLNILRFYCENKLKGEQ